MTTLRGQLCRAASAYWQSLRALALWFLARPVQSFGACLLLAALIQGLSILAALSPVLNVLVILFEIAMGVVIVPLGALLFAAIFGFGVKPPRN